MRLRLLTYNVKSFRFGVDRVISLVETVAPDVMFLQECGSKRHVARFALRLRMEAVSTHRPFNRVHNAVVFRPPFRLHGFEARTFSRDGAMRPRGFVASRLWGSGLRLTAVSAHLGLAAGERKRHARELTDFLQRLDGPIVMGVDLNEPPDAPAARWIAQRFFDVFAHAGTGSGNTFPSDAPAARIDYLFVNDRVAVGRCRVPSSPAVVAASDHRPVAAEVEVRA